MNTKQMTETEVIDWHTVSLDVFASIIEDDRRLIEQLDEQGTPSTLVRASIAKRAAIYKERLAAEQG